MSKEHELHGKLGGLFTLHSHHKLQNKLNEQCREQQEYIEKLQEVLTEHGIALPERALKHLVSHHDLSFDPKQNKLEDASESEIQRILEHARQYIRASDIALEYTHLSYKVYAPKTREIVSVTTLLKSALFFWRAWGEKREVPILLDVTGRIKPRKMTLLIGPPGSGKSVLMKALGGRLRPEHGAKLEGDVFYQGDSIHSGKFIPAKVAAYTEQGDTHDPVLTVEETIKFAWLATTGGKFSYARAKDEQCVAIMDEEDKGFVMVKNYITALGLDGCKDTYVGNNMVRGVSGGQKRRVTVGEMAVCPRPIALLDSISNGLDSATTFDIVRACRQVNKFLGNTVLISLLQPSPDVFDLFDEIIVLSEGEVVYHGPRADVQSYFESLGYQCPPLVDLADFLQELPTADGKRFLNDPAQRHDTATLVKKWKSSRLFETLLCDMNCAEYSQKNISNIYPAKDLESNDEAKITPHTWYADQNESFPGSFLFYLRLQLARQGKLVLRDATFLRSRIGQSLIVGAISGSLFNNIATQDIATLNGFLFGTVLFGALGSFSVFPIVYEQKKVFYKQSDALFFPTAAFTLAQSVCLFPLTLLEQVIYITIVYWSAGLDESENGSRFITFIVLTLACVLCMGQLFRLIAAIMPDEKSSLSVAGLVILIMVLFSGFIQPKSIISDGWIWFYWLNPIAWTLKAVTVNQLTAPRYDFLICTDPTCSHPQRFGDFVLSQYGNPTDIRYVWYSFAVVIAEFLLLFVLTFLAMKYLRTEVVPLPPVRVVVVEGEGETEHHAPSSLLPLTDDTEAQHTERDTERDTHKTEEPPHKAEETEQPHNAVSQQEASLFDDAQLPFDPVSLAFRDVWYTVTLASGEDVDLLKGVDGYFEPGVMTALMGATGAGKTTLLDVLAGRKNTGTIRGEICVNGVPKVESHFRKVMAYVEQFDTLPQKSTAREAIAFSAALRLSPNITKEQRHKWVDTVLTMLDLDSIADELVGDIDEGGMTFEQRKRVSIGVELAANPSILFLDEPTTGLDSRAAQALIRNIRRIASSGRTIVCTIHQPSTAIFSSFDALLLLRRGGQTVFFGDLGEHCETLVTHFESAGAMRLVANVNPASWMLEVIGAGTGAAAAAGAVNAIDFHAWYKQSALCANNTQRLHVYLTPNEGSQKTLQDTGSESERESVFNATISTQFSLLLQRVLRAYWRTPSYAMGRFAVNVFIALIFGSAYPQQTYGDYVAVVSRTAVIFVTTLFCGILALLNVIPVATADRVVFYRETQSNMYSTWVYALTTIVVEIPYILVISLGFTLPFFYIVGFDSVGDATQRFFWYWLFNFAYQFTMLNLGLLFVAIAPTEKTSHVLAGLTNTVLGYFCGFLIAEQTFPSFWLFMYWLDPLHYALEGLVMTMFHRDDTPVQTMSGAVVTAEEYVTKSLLSTWKYEHVGFDILALALFTICSLLARYLCLVFLRHDKR